MEMCVCLCVHVPPADMVYPISCHQCFCQSAKKNPQRCYCPYSRPNAHKHAHTHKHTLILCGVLFWTRKYTNKHYIFVDMISKNTHRELHCIFNSLLNLTNFQHVSKVLVYKTCSEKKSCVLYTPTHLYLNNISFDCKKNRAIIIL